MKPASACKCADCDRVACDYDHRDYSRPLDVEPVCRSCNSRRGPALFSVADAKTNESQPPQGQKDRAMNADPVMTEEQLAEADRAYAQAKDSGALARDSDRRALQDHINVNRAEVAS